MAPYTQRVEFIAIVHIGKNEHLFLSGTTRPRSLIFGLKHHQVDLFQVCSNYPGTINVPPGGILFYILKDIVVKSLCVWNFTIPQS